LSTLQYSIFWCE